MQLRWSKEYNKKLITVNQAVKFVQSGDWIEYGFGLTSARDFDKALAKRTHELWDVNIRCDIGVYPHYTAEADPTGEHFTWNSWHVAAQDKKYIGKNLYYVPMKFHENPGMTRRNCDPINIAVIQVTPMDQHGYFNFGAAAVNNWAMIETAEITILEVNNKMPYCLGGVQESVHISRVDYVFESKNEPPMALCSEVPNPVEIEIAEHIMNKLYNGNCIQLGIGGISKTIGKMVANSDLKDLGVHTDVYADAYLEMVKADKITCAFKNLDRYKQVYSFVLGSRELYEYVNSNPGLASNSIDYTNDPRIIAQIDDFVSIHDCLEVDLFGQVCSESIGTRHISGTGGQLDFVEGAYKSKNGQSFLCLPSTYEKKGKVYSRIKSILTPGAIVTDPRSATHMLVTEYGIANMKGKSTWQRAEALINIAHPDFRDELIEDAQIMKIWKRSNRVERKRTINRAVGI
jgi:butyryl-CoA:acetate CoA-transferase